MPFPADYRSRWIRLSDSRGRDARVRMVSRSKLMKRPLQTTDGRTVEPARLIKLPLERGYEALRSRCEDDGEIAQLIIEADPEIDLEAAGRRAGPTDRVLLDGEGLSMPPRRWRSCTARTGARSSDGRPRTAPPISTATGPVVWTGRTIPREKAARGYAFTRQYQVRHVDGLTYDFLFAMAAELDRANCLVRVGAGPRGREPLILERKGTPYRGFLEGRIDGDRYRLVLHLTNLELKTPAGDSLA